MELTSVAVIEWQFSVSAVKVRLVIQKLRNKQTNLKQEWQPTFWKKIKKTQKFLDERFFNFLTEHQKTMQIFKSRNFLLLGQTNIQTPHSLFVCCLCACLPEEEELFDKHTNSTHLSVLFVCLFARRRGNSSEIYASSCGVQTCKTLLTY